MIISKKDCLLNYTKKEKKEKITMKKKTIAKTGATMLTMAMLLNGTTVFAAANTYASVTGGTVNIEKYLVVKSTATVPNVTFNFTIKGKAGSNASATVADGVQVFAGNDANRVTGVPTIGTAVFTNADTKYDTAQDLVSTGIQVTTGTKDPVTLTAGQSYAKHDVSVDFTNVTFNEPGIYRYEITENADTTGTVTNDADTTRIMDVYVIDDEGTLKIQGYVLHNNEGAVKQDGTSATGKAEGYVNTMEAKDVKVEKKVTGNQASHDEYFKITLKIEKALPNTIYTVDLANADATTTTNGANTVSYTNAATITTDADGKATVDYWLQHGQSIIVRSMNIGATYEMNEDKTAMNNEGYVATITSTDTSDTTENENYKVSGKIETGDGDQIDISFSNKRSGVIPTGVIMTVAPFAAVTLLGAVGMVTIKMRKKEDDEE